MLISKTKAFKDNKGGNAGKAGKGGASVKARAVGKAVATSDPAGLEAATEAAVVRASRFSVDGAPLYRASRDELVALLPFPAQDANKYTRGKLVLVAGSNRYPGAACLSARAAARMGAGYIEAVVPAEVKPLLVAAEPSVVATVRKQWDPDCLQDAKQGHPQAVCMGPGFDAADKEAQQLVLDVLRASKHPVLVDGGALAVLATKKGRKALRRRFEQGLVTVVTPHEGEAARLAKPFDLPMDNPARAAALLSLAYGFTVVLKGPNTFVSDGEQTFAVTEGTPDLAKAGTGDVLAGMTGALLAQGLPAVQAGVLGAALHARAGALAGKRFTSFGVRAEDVADSIPAAIIELIG